MQGGKRDGAGRPPVPEKKPSITVTIRKDQKEWLATQRKGWLAKFIEIGVDEEIMENKALIARTAIDYDMEEHEVERILKMYPGSFYKELENFIADRARE